MPPFVIAISGGSGSGKSTLAAALAARFPDETAVLCQDWYYRDLSHLDESARASQNFDAPDAIDVERLAADLRALRAGDPVSAPSYDFTRHLRTGDTLRIYPKPLIVLEGLHVTGMTGLSGLADLRVYVDAPAPLRLERRLARDMRERGRSAGQVLAQYRGTVEPMHEQHVAPLRESADAVVDGARPPEEAVALLVPRIPLRGGARVGQ